MMIKVKDNKELHLNCNAGDNYFFFFLDKTVFFLKKERKSKNINNKKQQQNYAHRKTDRHEQTHIYIDVHASTQTDAHVCICMQQGSRKPEK